MLHLLAGAEMILPDGSRGLLADALTPAKGGQRRIGELGAGGHELFMDANQITVAAPVQVQDLVAIGRGLFLAHQGGYDLRGGTQHLPHRPA